MNVCHVWRYRILKCCHCELSGEVCGGGGTLSRLVGGWSWLHWCHATREDDRAGLGPTVLGRAASGVAQLSSALVLALYTVVGEGQLYTLLYCLRV